MVLHDESDVPETIVHDVETGRHAADTETTYRSDETSDDKAKLKNFSYAYEDSDLKKRAKNLARPGEYVVVESQGKAVKLQGRGQTFWIAEGRLK